MAARGGTTPTALGTSPVDRAGTKDTKGTTTSTVPAGTSAGITAITRAADRADRAAVAEGSRVAAVSKAVAVSTGTGAGAGLSAETCGQRP